MGKKKALQRGPLGMVLKKAFKSADHIESLPSESICRSSSEVTVGGCLGVNRAEEIEPLDDRLRSHVEEFVDRYSEFLFVNFGRTKSVD